MKESRYNTWVDRRDASYVFNGVSGALLRIPRTERELLRGMLAGEDAASSPEVLAHLARGRMLVNDDVDELAVLAERYRWSRFDTTRFALTLVTSLGCNFDCPYCFEAKHPSVMDSDVRELILRVLDDQLDHIESFRATWFGGEPLVGKRPLIELSDAFIERCDAAGVDYSASIVTNGYLLDEDMCVKLRDRRVDAVQVGLDGPPDVHDRMRPLAGGGASFERIVANLRTAVHYLPVTVRVNVDLDNFDRVDELLERLATEGLAGKLSVYPGQLIASAVDASAPSARYSAPCFTAPEFARAELRFHELARARGFVGQSLPRPTGAPCTAVRANELVVGSKGELYKCWESVGNPDEVIGHIRDYRDPNGRLSRWLRYDPFANDECRSCVALPVCMGGCAVHAMDPLQYENRCGTFRFAHGERVASFVEVAERNGADGLVQSSTLARQMEPTS
jgi:uncharacterized protein